MNIHEYQAKQLFNDYGIVTPLGKVARNPRQVEQSVKELSGTSWVVKAQVHAGGRGQAGGVQLVENSQQAVDLAEKLFGSQLITKQTGAEGLPVESVLIEEASDFKREFYLSLLVDRSSESMVFIASAAGGMDIEAVAEETPEKIITTIINPAAGLQSYQCRKIAYALQLSGRQVGELEKIMRGMIRLFLDTDASLLEINPLIESVSGELSALDAKINFDDNALDLHSAIAELRDPAQEDEKENLAQLIGLNYIRLDGNIGCMVNGAGLAMATMDLVKLKGGEPANFLDVGGGTTADKVSQAFKLILSDGDIKAVLVNIFGGIVQCDIIAKGILQAVKDINVSVPIVVRLEGTNAEEGLKLLNESELAVIAEKDLEYATEKVVQLARSA